MRKRHLAPWVQWLLVIIASIDFICLASINDILEWSALPIIALMLILLVAIMQILRRWGKGIYDE